MRKSEDPRVDATRKLALDAALDLLRDEGVLAVTHAAVNARTGISRSTLYRHWPKLEALRNDAFLRAATSPVFRASTDGPLRDDLRTIMNNLMAALKDTPWGRIAPQVIAVAATDEVARKLINDFMADRIGNVDAVLCAARDRGEIAVDAPMRQVIETAIAVPYFRHLIAGLPLDEAWLESHVEMLWKMATRQPL